MEDLDKSVNDSTALNFELVWKLRTLKNDLDLVIDLLDDSFGEVLFGGFNSY